METKAYINLVWLVLFAILFACNESNRSGNDSNIDQQDVLSQEEEVKTTLINMWDAIEKEDIELYASYIHPDFTQFGESDPTLKIGRETEVNGTNEWIKNSSNIHTEMEEPIVVIRDSVAWIIYYWKDSGTTNGEAFSSRGKSTRIFVKEKGRWLCIHGHYTLLP
jgi:ketosteroid isomerase-like protein